MENSTDSLPDEAWENMSDDEFYELIGDELERGLAE